MKNFKLHLPASGQWQWTLFVMFVAQFIVAVGFSSIFPFLPFYVEELGTNTSFSVEFLAGMVYSSQAFTMMIAAPFWGLLADRTGRKLMVERAMFGGAVILFLMAFSRTAEDLIVLRAIQGLITGTVAAANALVAAEVPRNKMGFAMGLLQVGFGTGLAIGPFIGGLVADQFGYSATFFVTAAMLFSAGVLVLIGVREKYVPVVEKSAVRLGFFSKWQHIFAETGVLAAYSLRFLSSLGRMLIIPIIPLFVQMLMTDTTRLNTFTGLIMGSASASTTISSVLLGRWGDQIGHRKVFIASALGSMLLYFPQGLITQTGQLLILQICVGIAVGGLIPSISAMLAEYTQRGEEGAVYGLDNSINSAGRALAPLLGGWIAASLGLPATFLAVGLIFLLSAAVAFWFLPAVQTAEIAPDMI